MDANLANVDGAAELEGWFGYWPNFHDAEVVSIVQNRTGTSTLSVHTWEMSDRVDKLGYYILQKHVLVDFEMTGISNLQLEGCSPEIPFGLNIEKRENVFRIELNDTYGIGGYIEAGKLRIKLTPMTPADLA